MADIHDGNEARGIKLFGTTITLHNHNNKIPSADQDSTKTLSGSKTFEKIQKTNIDQDSTKSLPDNKTLEERDHQDSTVSSSGSKFLEKRSKITTDQDTTKSSSSESEALDNKKPDKIVPCPRCKSKETKFCYFNNYNVNQPRHFCRACQRYWTAGGALRDVPIGAGRRKNKPPCLSSDIGQQFQFDDVAEEWYGGFEHVPAKKHLRWS